ncbi:MAG TPA: hypothetical protein DCX34_11245, partial [Roseovarius sp.]|nr:hypothetical protein [Roseovarius sp.]
MSQSSRVGLVPLTALFIGLGAAAATAQTLGAGATATGIDSVALGDNSLASGDGSTA